MSIEWRNKLEMRVIDQDQDYADFRLSSDGELVVESESGDEVLLTRDDAIYLAREILKNANVSEEAEFSMKEDDIVPLECMLMDAIAEEFDKRTDNGSTEWDCQKVAMSNRVSELLWSLHNGN